MLSKQARFSLNSSTMPDVEHLTDLEFEELMYGPQFVFGDHLASSIAHSNHLPYFRVTSKSASRQMITFIIQSVFHVCINLAKRGIRDSPILKKAAMQNSQGSSETVRA